MGKPALVGFRCDDPDIVGQRPGDALQHLKSLGVNAVVIGDEYAHCQSP